MSRLAAALAQRQRGTYRLSLRELNAVLAGLGGTSRRDGQDLLSARRSLRPFPTQLPLRCICGVPGHAELRA
jgi:hypothetical protein